MSDQERNIMRQSAVGSQLSRSPAVKFLIIANVVIFLLDIVLEPKGPTRSPLFELGHFNIVDFKNLQLWRLLTFQFLHGGAFHLFMNMYGLYSFAPFVERYWGTKRFVWFYLLCGMSGSLLYAALFQFTNVFSYMSPHSTLVGASAGIFGILVAVAILAPQVRIMLLFPPIPMTMRTFAVVFLSISLGTIFFRGNNAGGEAGHLGGALVGFLLMKFPQLVPGNQKAIRRKQTAEKYEPKLRPRSSIDLKTDPKLDALLDKINEHGFQSLSAEEREYLSNAAAKKDNS